MVCVCHQHAAWPAGTSVTVMKSVLQHEENHVYYHHANSCQHVVYLAFIVALACEQNEALSH